MLLPVLCKFCIIFVVMASIKKLIIAFLSMVHLLFGHYYLGKLLLFLGSADVNSIIVQNILEDLFSSQAAPHQRQEYSLARDAFRWRILDNLDPFTGKVVPIGLSSYRVLGFSLHSSEFVRKAKPLNKAPRKCLKGSS